MATWLLTSEPDPTRTDRGLDDDIPRSKGRDLRGDWGAVAPDRALPSPSLEELRHSACSLDITCSYDAINGRCVRRPTQSPVRIVATADANRLRRR